MQMDELYGAKGAEMFFCPPKNITLGQAARIVVKYLNDHPEQLHNATSYFYPLPLERGLPLRE